MEDWFVLPLLAVAAYFICKAQAYYFIILFGTPLQGKWRLLGGLGRRDKLIPVSLVLSCVLLVILSSFLPDNLQLLFVLGPILVACCVFSYSLARSVRVGLVSEGLLGDKTEWGARIWASVCIATAAAHYWSLT